MDNLNYSFVRIKPYPIQSVISTDIPEHKTKLSTEFISNHKLNYQVIKMETFASSSHQRFIFNRHTMEMENKERKRKKKTCVQ